MSCPLWLREPPGRRTAVTVLTLWKNGPPSSSCLELRPSCHTGFLAISQTDVHNPEKHEIFLLQMSANTSHPSFLRAHTLSTFRPLSTALHLFLTICLPWDTTPPALFIFLHILITTCWWRLFTVCLPLMEWWLHEFTAEPPAQVNPRVVETRDATECHTVIWQTLWHGKSIFWFMMTW
jgi:hypothetical protein